MRFHCWVYREDVKSIFHLEISKRKTVEVLKTNIINKESNRFHGVDVDKVRLYCIPTPRGDSEHLEDKLKQLSLDEKSSLDSQAKLSALFPESQEEEWLIVVDMPNSGSSVAQPPAAVVPDMTLNCWIYGDVIGNVFLVDISSTKTIAALKEAIKDKRAEALRDVDADDLDLYKPNNYVPRPYQENLSKIILSEHAQLLQMAGNKLSEVFLDLPPKHIHIIVAGPSVAAIMPDITLNCWVRGQEVHRIFTVEISSAKTITVLQNIIKNNKPDLGDIDADALDLYKVSLPDDEDLEQALEGLTFGPHEVLCSTKLLSLVFPTPPPERHVHIVIATSTNYGTTPPQVEPDDILTALTESFRRTTTVTSKSLTPSRAAESSEYAKIQTGDQRLLDCRCAAGNPINTVAPPIQLFNPAFAFFSSKASDLNYDVPDKFVLHVRDLVVQFALIHPNEDARQRSLKFFLQRVVGRPFVVASDPDRTDPDFGVLGLCGGLTVYLVIGEEMNEFGDGGSDPSTQAAFSFLRLFSQKENSELRLKCCCPTFIIAHAGPWLTIMGGIITANCVVQRLTDFLWVPAHSTHDDDQCRRIARVFYALRESIGRLDSWYRSIKDVKPLDPSALAIHPRFFPSPNAFRYDGAVVKFAYQKPLERNVSCVTYLAKTIEASPKRIVVKFVTSYGVDAHQHMASIGFAPQLLYHGKINVDVDTDIPLYGDLRMVVMEYVQGLTFEEALKQKTVFAKFKTDLCQALDQLHSAGYVFGNLRQPNVIVTPHGRRFTAQLIDFDWAGKEGKVKYPISISSSIDWPAGVKGLAPIRKEHDLVMLGLLTSH